MAQAQTTHGQTTQEQTTQEQSVREQPNTRNTAQVNAAQADTDLLPRLQAAARILATGAARSLHKHKHSPAEALELGRTLEIGPKAA